MLQYSSVSKSCVLRRAAVRRVTYILVGVSVVRRQTILPTVAYRRNAPIQKCARSSTVCYSTLSSDNFEIDLITLKKIPLARGSKEPVSFDIDFGKEVFVQDNYNEFYRFLKFAAPSHGTSFNSLVAKVDEYALQKGVNVDVLQRMKHEFSLVEEVLHYFEIARNNAIILELQLQDFDYLMPELKVLAQEFDFNSVTVDQFTQHLSDTLARFDIETGSFEKSPEFFQILIQCNRYRTLRDIVSSAYEMYPPIDVSSNDDLGLLSKLISNTEYSTAEDYPKLYESFIRDSHIDILTLLLGYFTSTYDKIDTAQFLAGLQTIIDDKKTQLVTSRELAKYMRDEILHWSGTGVLSNFQDDVRRPVIEYNYGAPKKFADDVVENYAYNVIDWLFGNDPSLIRLLKRLDENFIETIFAHQHVDLSKVDLDPMIVETIKKAEENVIQFFDAVNHDFDALENFAIEGCLPGMVSNKSDIVGREYLKGYVVDLRDIKKRYLQDRFEFSDLNISLLKLILNKYVLEKGDQSLLATIEGLLARNPNNVEGVLSELDCAIYQETSVYKQVPNDIHLEHFTSQLNELSKEFLPAIAHGKFSLCTAEEILSSIRGVIANSDKEINELVVWNKLYGTLVKLFAINNNHTFVLDTLLVNVAVFENFESDNKLSTVPPVPEFVAPSEKTYVQLPDDFRLDQFIKEIANLKDYLGIDSFTEVTSEEVLAACETLVAWESPRYPYLNLQSNLLNLFKLNNNHTAVLDNLLISQSVFEAMELKLLSKEQQVVDERSTIAVPTINLEPQPANENLDLESPLSDRAWLAEAGPDMLHVVDSIQAPVYAYELSELRNKLPETSFYKSTNLEIFETLNTMIDECTEEQSARKLNLRKLCYNMNGANLSSTSRLNLDRYLGHTIYGSETLAIPEVVDETNLEPSISVVGQNATLVNQFYALIRAFLIKLSLWDQKNNRVSTEKFIELLTSFESQLDKKAPNYVDNLRAINHLKSYASTLDLYPDFIQQLCELKSFKPDKDLSVKDVESAYKVLIQTADYEADLAEPEMSTVNGSHDMDALEKDFATTEGNTENKSMKYNDSEKLLALLGNNEDNVTLQDNDLFNHMIHEHDISEYCIKDAVSSSKSTGANEEDKKTLYFNHPKHHHVTPKKVRGSGRSEPPENIDMSSIEEFLENAKHEFQTAKEERAKVREAYQWSKNSSSGHKSGLEDIDYLARFSKHRLEKTPLFPSYRDHHAPKSAKGNAYMLLSVDGHKIQTHEHPLGKKSSSEDIFEVLGKFRKEELDSIADNIEALQKEGWKIVGSKVEPKSKYLILEKVESSSARRSSGRGGFGRSIKNAFAGIGVVLASLIGINVMLEGGGSHDTRSVPSTTPLPTPTPAPVASVPIDVEQTLQQSQMAIAEDVSRLINDQSSGAPNKQSSILSKIMWKKD